MCHGERCQPPAMSYHGHGSNRLSHITVVSSSEQGLQPFNQAATCSFGPAAVHLTHPPVAAASISATVSAAPHAESYSHSQEETQFNSNSNNVLSHPPPLIPAGISQQPEYHHQQGIEHSSLQVAGTYTTKPLRHVDPTTGVMSPPAPPPPHPPELIPICPSRLKNESSKGKQQLTHPPPTLWHPSQVPVPIPWPMPPGAAAKMVNVSTSAAAAAASGETSSGKYFSSWICIFLKLY